MIPTIEMLEKEIEQFHKNVAESNELINLLTAVVDITKKQTLEVGSQTEKIQSDLKQLPPELSGIFQDSITSFTQSVAKENEEYQKSIAQLMAQFTDRVKIAEKAVTDVPATISAEMGKQGSEYRDTLLKIKEEYVHALSNANNDYVAKQDQLLNHIQGLLADMKTDSKQQYTSYLDGLKELCDERLKLMTQTEQRLELLSKQLEEKYTTFTVKLEETNMDQLYKYCQEMNRSLNAKITIAIACGALSVLIAIIGLFI